MNRQLKMLVSIVKDRLKIFIKLDLFFLFVFHLGGESTDDFENFFDKLRYFTPEGGLIKYLD